MKFSVITPTFNRFDGRLQRCVDSVSVQTYRDYEYIVVDDGSTDGTQAALSPFAQSYGAFRGGKLRYIRIEHQGRVIARNAGMEAARGEWLCWLDSDDCYDPMYLATFAHYIEKEPDVRLWVGGVVYHGMYKDDDGNHAVPRWTKIRPAWMPPVNCDGGHEHFPSGKVGTGMFVFHRECLEKTGLLPPWKNHNEIADGVDEWLGYETGYSSAKKLCGNPYGDDWAFFRRLTQFYRVSLVEACLYVQYVR